MQYLYNTLTICRQDALSTNGNGLPFPHQWQWGTPPTNISIIQRSLYYHSFILSLSLYYTYNMHIRSSKYPCNILRLSSQYANGWYPAAPIQESQSRIPNPAIQIQESQCSIPNPGISIQEGCTSHQWQWGALPYPALPIQETQSRRCAQSRSGALPKSLQYPFTVLMIS